MSDVLNMSYGSKIESMLIHNNGGIATTRDLRAQMAEIAGIAEKEAHDVGQGNGLKHIR